MKRLQWKQWLILMSICLPLIVMVGIVQVAHRTAEERRRQHALNVALFEAAQSNAVPQVEALLARGAEVSALQTYEEPDVSWQALWQQWWGHMKGSPTPNVGNHIGVESAFDVALDNAAQSQFKDWRVLKILVDHGADVNALNVSGAHQTALDWVTELQNWEVTDYLLEKGATPNATGMMDSNPFLQSVACDKLSVVKKMLDKGANVNFVPANSGESPLCIAVIHENPAMIRLLLDRGADINLPNRQGQTPLHRCQGSAHEVETVALLLRRGADPNRQNREGDTPLLAAAAYDDPEIIRLYLAHKADPKIRNQRGQTALQLAQSRHYKDIVTLLTPITSPGAR